MPIYEYQCRDCEHIFDQLRRRDEMDDAIDCPKCNSSETKRKLSVFGVGSTGNQHGCKMNGGPKSPSCGG